VVLTDLDPQGAEPPLAQNRIRRLLEIVAPQINHAASALAALFNCGRAAGFFVNNHTLEAELFTAGLNSEMVGILKRELSLSGQSVAMLDQWDADPQTVDPERLVKFIERVGKGRFAQLLSADVDGNNCPTYIKTALERIRDAVA
jgi:putative ATP-dependent endonuclease of OLD family